jgi:hypothetical protein
MRIFYEVYEKSETSCHEKKCDAKKLKSTIIEPPVGTIDAPFCLSHGS